jgi:hypothetical protein
MLPISLDQNLARKLEQGMRSGDVVDLSFPVVYIWALNGQASYKSQGGALYYGGWACKAEDLQAISNQSELSIPADWKLVTIASRDGGEFEAYTARSLIVAPIGKRESWLVDGKRSSEYIEGGRRHLQVLAYMAEGRGENGSKQFIPWGPVVLTAKGYQARNLLDAFARWNKATAQIRWKVAPGIPAWCFYMALGTFGRERQSVNVGKPGAQSPITPIGAYVHDHFSEELISNLFVGNEVAAVMAELQDQAADWLKAWREPSIAEAETESEPAAVFPQEEDIPF